MPIIHSLSHTLIDPRSRCQLGETKVHKDNTVRSWKGGSTRYPLGVKKELCFSYRLIIICFLIKSTDLMMDWSHVQTVLQNVGRFIISNLI